MDHFLKLAEWSSLGWKSREKRIKTTNCKRCNWCCNWYNCLSNF